MKPTGFRIVFCPFTGPIADEKWIYDEKLKVVIVNQKWKKEFLKMIHGEGECE